MGKDNSVDAQKQIASSYFDSNGEDISTLDPYNYGGHIGRFYLWIALGYIQISDHEDVVRLLLSGQAAEGGEAFRRLDTNDHKSFEEHLKNIGAKIVKYPKR